METLHYLLMKAHSRMHRQICTRAAELNLTSGQPKILEYLFRYGEHNQKAISAYCEIEQATVGSILLRMEAAGLVIRSQRAGNRRSLYVTLTPKGQTAAEKMADAFADAEAEVSGTLTPAEQLQLRQLLEKLCGAAWGKEAEI